DRRRLEHDLVLVVVLQPVRVLPVAPVLRTARRLHVGGAPRFRADRPQERGGVEGACADLHVVGLQQCAPLVVPILLQAQDQLLEAEHGAVAASKKVILAGSIAGTGSHPGYSDRGTAPFSRPAPRSDAPATAMQPSASTATGRLPKRA